MTPKDVATIRVAQNGISLGSGVLAFLILAALVLGIWIYRGWTVGAQRDAWWRTEISRKSEAVKKVVSSGDAEAKATDDQVIAALGDSDEQLAAKEKELAELRKKVPRDPEPDSCPRVPARCVIP